MGGVVDVLVLALLWLAITLVAVLCIAPFVAVREVLRHFDERRKERRVVAHQARLEGLVTEALRVAKLLQQPPKPEVDTPETRAAADGIKQAVEDALRDSGFEMPEGWK